MELKPCPFCGGKDVRLIPTGIGAPSRWCVLCNDCHTEGPVDLGESGAIEKWNTRPGERAAAVAGWEWRDYRDGSGGMMSHGPNVTKLILKFVAREAIPSGGGIADGLLFFMDPEKRRKILAKAEGEVISAIALIRAAPDNPYGDDDEVIAGALLAKIAERQDAHRRSDKAAEE